MFLKQGLILSSIVLVTSNKWLVLRNKLNYSHTKIRAKVQPHQPSILFVYPTQMLNYLRLFTIVVFVVRTKRAPVNSISWLFRWSSSCQKAIITYHCWQWHTVSYAWRLHLELTKNNWSHSQLSYKIERNIMNSKWLTLTGKQAQRNTPKKLSRSYHLIMSIFSSFHFVAVMKILASKRW